MFNLFNTKEDTKRCFFWAVGMFLVGNALDFITSSIPVPGLVETNELFRNAVTKEFALYPAFVIKGLWLGICLLPISLFIKKISGSWRMAAVPIVMNSLGSFEAALNNAALIFHHYQV